APSHEETCNVTRDLKPRPPGGFLGSLTVTFVREGCEGVPSHTSDSSFLCLHVSVSSRDSASSLPSITVCPVIVYTAPYLCPLPEWNACGYSVGDSHLPVVS
ncbi:unnamed protein product, partial [Ectocarpus sp. 12 AP-2014]